MRRLLTIALFPLLQLLSCGVSGQPDQARDAALREIEQFTVMQARTDPHYKAVEAAMIDKVDAVVQGSAPAEWLPAIRRLYFAASERLHREEREKIASEERAVYAAPPSQEATWASFERRLLEINKGLEDGRWGPRGQALHALEAAKLYFPNDADFLGYRQARVPIATAYEMGRISREEFDARWARAGDEFRSKQRATDQANARIGMEAARAEYEATRDAINRSQRPPTSCTSSVVYGKLQTVCR